jgi:hypothetical protein
MAWRNFLVVLFLAGWGAALVTGREIAPFHPVSMFSVGLGDHAAHFFVELERRDGSTVVLDGRGDLEPLDSELVNLMLWKTPPAGHAEAGRRLLLHALANYRRRHGDDAARATLWVRQLAWGDRGYEPVLRLPVARLDAP